MPCQHAKLGQIAVTAWSWDAAALPLLAPRDAIGQWLAIMRRIVEVPTGDRGREQCACRDRKRSRTLTFPLVDCGAKFNLLGSFARVKRDKRANSETGNRVAARPVRHGRDRILAYSHSRCLGGALGLRPTIHGRRLRRNTECRYRTDRQNPDTRRPCSDPIPKHFGGQTDYCARCRPVLRRPIRCDIGTARHQQRFLFGWHTGCTQPTSFGWTQVYP